MKLHKLIKDFGIPKEKAKEIAKAIEENFTVINTFEPSEEMTKIDTLKAYLNKYGSVSNVGALNGAIGFRTSRLADMIFKLKRIGWEFETKELKYKNGTYKDCVYTVKGEI